MFHVYLNIYLIQCNIKTFINHFMFNYLQYHESGIIAPHMETLDLSKSINFKDKITSPKSDVLEVIESTNKI